MTVDEWRAAVRPKVHGSWNLHECLPKDLDFFVLLSSATSKIGQPGQSNYSAGNAFLNALARYRAFNGLRATTLDLGVILSIGFLAEDDTAMGALRKFGANSMREEEYYAVLDEVCNPNTTQPSLLKSCLTLNLATPEGLRLSGIDQVEWMTEPLFRHLFRIRPLHRSLESAKTSREHGSGPDGTADEFVNARLALSAAESHDAAAEIVYNAFVAKICKSLNIGKQTVDGSRPLHALGVDSLVAIELRTWVVKEVGAEVTPFDLMESGSIHEIASLAASRSSFVKNFEGEE